MNNLLVRDMYREETLNRALGRLEAPPQTSADVEDLFVQVGIDKRTLARTVQKGVEEYIDGLVDLRHGWKPKMMDGSPEEKKELYDGLAATIRRMDEFSEPYVSAMRLISDVALRQLAVIATHSTGEDGRSIEEALNYKGAHYDFDEHRVRITSAGETVLTKRKKLASVTDAYSQITNGFMHLKDLLNLVEAATSMDVYENVTNTNEFPEARIGQCFESAHEIDRTMREVVEGYGFLSKKSNLSRADKGRIDETLKLLKGVDRNWITISTQWYAALQFNEKPWDKAYKISIAATAAGIGGSIYSLAGGTNDWGLFFASAGWTVASGTAIYFFTDAGPKTAKSLRKLDERIIRYKWI